MFEKIATVGLAMLRVGAWVAGTYWLITDIYDRITSYGSKKSKEGWEEGYKKGIYRGAEQYWLTVSCKKDFYTIPHPREVMGSEG